MSDVVERLKERMTLKYIGGCKCGHCQLVHEDTIVEAASTITALQERVNVLEGLVRGFAALQLTNVNGGTDNALMQTDRLTAAPLVLSARTALGEKK